MQKRQPEHCPTAVNGNVLCLDLDLKSGFEFNRQHLIINRDSLDKPSDQGIRILCDCLGLLIQKGGKILDAVLHVLSHCCLRQDLLSFFPQLHDRVTDLINLLLVPAGIKELRMLLLYGSIDLGDLLISIFFQDRSDVFPQFGKN